MRVVQRPTADRAVQEKLQSVRPGGVVQLYRYPGLSESKANTLLRKAHDKASAKITGIDGELVRLLGGLGRTHCWYPLCPPSQAKEPGHKRAAFQLDEVVLWQLGLCVRYG